MNHLAQNDAIRCCEYKHWIHYACVQMYVIYIMLLDDTTLMFFCIPCICARVSNKILNNDVPDGLKKLIVLLRNRIRMIAIFPILRLGRSEWELSLMILLMKVFKWLMFLFWLMIVKVGRMLQINQSSKPYLHGAAKGESHLMIHVFFPWYTVGSDNLQSDLDTVYWTKGWTKQHPI